jgi:hypothetical protein
MRIQVDSRGNVHVSLPEGGELELMEVRGQLSIRAVEGTLSVKPESARLIRVQVEGLPYEPPRWRDDR